MSGNQTLRGRGGRSLVLLLAILTPVAVFADQTIPAGSYAGGTWDVGEMITLGGTVSLAGTLNISPGVRVMLPAEAGFEVSPGGTLVSAGSEASPITFTSGEGSPACGDWSGIRFLAGSAGSLAHTVIEFAKNGVLVEGASPSITHCTIQDLCGEKGVAPSDGQPAQPGADATGIHVKGASAPIITDNVIRRITGGEGGDGNIDSDGTERDSNGVRGGGATGILIDHATLEAPPIERNLIHHLKGGDGGAGGTVDPPGKDCECYGGAGYWAVGIDVRWSQPTIIRNNVIAFMEGGVPGPHTYIYFRPDSSHGGGGGISTDTTLAWVDHNTIHGMGNPSSPDHAFGTGLFARHNQSSFFFGAMTATNNTISGIWGEPGNSRNRGVVTDTFHFGYDVNGSGNNNFYDVPGAYYVYGHPSEPWATDTATDPLFVDADALDFHLTFGSGLIGAGRVGVTESDMEGENRDGAPDIGADEFVEAEYSRAAAWAVGDFTRDRCTDLGDFLYLLDHWFAEVEGKIVELDSFLNLVDNWQAGTGCE